MSEQVENAEVVTEPAVEAPAAAVAPQYTDLIAQMTATNNNVAQIAGAVHQLAARQNAPAPVVEIDPFAGVDPETLTGARLVEYAKHQTRREMQAEITRVQFDANAKINQLQGLVKTQLLHQSNVQLEALKAKDPAKFDRLIPTMQNLAATHPTLGVNDVYNLASANTPGVKAPAAVTQQRVNPASERPTQSAARPPARAVRETPLPINWRARQSVLISEAYDAAASANRK